MTLTFVTNLVHHHQLPVADELYRLLGGDYHYIATDPLPDWLIKGGYDPNIERPYVIRTYQSEKNMDIARNLIDESDIVIFGAAPVDWVYKRKKANKITFHYNERWLKNLSIRLLSPKLIYYRFKHFTQFRNKRTYMLCASAFTAKDVRWYSAFPNKCFKWGYFTKVEEFLKVQYLDLDTSTLENTSIMWCARFLKWKHPELPVKLADRLKKKGYKFYIDMYGSGEELENIKVLISNLGVEDCVRLCGNLPNEEILKEMRKHSIFLFTSDRNEGWGAVLNEAMGNYCAVIGSNEIGSVPYLIKDGYNGLVFKSRSLDDFEKKVIYLLENPKEIVRISNNARETMRTIWSPQNAAKSLMNLVSYAIRNELNNYNVKTCNKLGENAYYTMLNTWNPKLAAQRFIKLSKSLNASKKSNIFEDGPCSKAYIIKDNWYKKGEKII